MPGFCSICRCGFVMDNYCCENTGTDCTYCCPSQTLPVTKTYEKLISVENVPTRSSGEIMVDCHFLYRCIGLGPLGSVKGRKVSSISMDDDSTGETSSVFSEQVSPQDQELSESMSTPDGLGLDDVDLSKNMTWIPVSDAVAIVAVTTEYFIRVNKESIISHIFQCCFRGGGN